MVGMRSEGEQAEVLGAPRCDATAPALKYNKLLSCVLSADELEMFSWLKNGRGFSR